MVATLFRHFEVMMMVFTPFVVKTEMKHPCIVAVKTSAAGYLQKDTFSLRHATKMPSQIEMDGNPTDRASHLLFC